MKGMQHNLVNVVTQIKTASADVATAVQQLAAASEQLSSGAQEQASSLEETAATLEEITATVKQNADNARQANQLAVGLPRRGREGRPGGRRRRVGDGRDQQSRPKKIADIITHHRRDRLPDQPPGPQRRRRGGPRRRAGPRLRGGRRRGAQPGPALAPRPPRRSRP